MRLRPVHLGFHRFLLRIPMRGYERARVWLFLSDARLRIPMRGYEASRYAELALIPVVTNPHAGL